MFCDQKGNLIFTQPAKSNFAELANQTWPKGEYNGKTQVQLSVPKVLKGKVLWCDTRIPSILALIVRTRCQRITRGRKKTLDLKRSGDTGLKLPQKM